MIVGGKPITSDMFVDPELLVQKYSAITAADSKNDASQIRRCQNTVNVTGLMMPPTSYANLFDIMTIMV